jgi:hypothetical protein
MSDLIVRVDGDDGVDCERVEKAAQNVLNTLLLGMAGVGDLLWADCQRDDALSAHAGTQSIADVGYLMKLLSEQALAVFECFDNARFAINEKKKPALRARAK